jgi:hypothetical protein
LRRLAEVVKAEGDRLAADVVVPVPLHRARERERDTTKRPCSPSPWQKGSDCPTKRCC